MSADRPTVRRRVPIAAALVGCVAAAWLSAAPVRAQGPIDRGVELYEQADFEGALAALGEAEASGELERAALVRLLAVRALVDFALNRPEALERDLLMLASLEPGYDLGVRAPPAVRRSFERLREGGDGLLRVVLAVEPMPGGARVVASVHGDRAGMTRRVELAARAPSGEWRRGEDGSVVLPVASGGEVEAWARAVGPGGAVLATAGSEEAPRRLSVPAAVPEGGAATGGDAAGSGGDTWLWIGVGAGSAVLAAAVVALVIVLGGSGDGQTVLEGPRIDRGASSP